jgi:hypothetical protein
LDKIRELCASNGAELVLIKAPTNSRGYWWYDEWESQIIEYSNAHGVDYYNFIPHADEMGIDWQTDTYDGGLHLNVYGAEKFTKYLGQTLVSKYSLESHKDDAEICERWNNYFNEFKSRKETLEENKTYES